MKIRLYKVFCVGPTENNSTVTHYQTVSKGSLLPHHICLPSMVAIGIDDPTEEQAETASGLLRCAT